MRLKSWFFRVYYSPVLIVGLGVAYLVLLASAIGVLAVSMYVNPQPITPGAYYEPTLAYPQIGLLCPGETLSFDYQVVVVRSPLIVRAVESVFSLDQNRTLVADTDYSMVIETAQGVIQLHREYTLPLTLPPGRYEYRRAIEQGYSGTSALAVPFEVRQGCPLPAVIPTPTQEGD